MRWELVRIWVLMSPDYDVLAVSRDMETRHSMWSLGVRSYRGEGGMRQCVQGAYRREGVLKIGVLVRTLLIMDAPIQDDLMYH